MKKLMTMIAIQILGAITANADAVAITQWEETIPLTEERAIELIAEKAMEFSHRDDDTGNVCGGRTGAYELADYYTSEDYDGVVTHSLFIRFVATVAVDYCQDEKIVTCVAKFNATSPDDAHIARLNCR